MNTLELKNILMVQISQINDTSFLNALRTILESKTNNQIMVLNDTQKNEIFSSKKEIDNNLFIENDNLDTEILQWLQEK